MAGASAQKIPFGTALEPRASERDAPENLARFTYSALASLPNWQIVSENEVREVGQSLPPAVMLVGSNGSAKWFMPTR